MAIDPAQPFTLAGLAVQAIIDYYDGLSLELPARRLVAPGLPAYDCPMLAVHVERIYPTSGVLGVEEVPQLQGEVAFFMRGLTLAVYLLRCVPTLNADGSPPSTDDEEIAASAIYADAIHLEAALVAALVAGDLPGCGGLAWAGWESITPEGVLGGGVLRVRLSLE